jgi:hypothetical protein
VVPIDDSRTGPVASTFGASPEENESAYLFESIRSGGVLDIGQVFADASWDILARFFLAGWLASGAAERDHRRSPATAEALKMSTTRSFKPPLSWSSARRSPPTFTGRRRAC